MARTGRWTTPAALTSPPSCPQVTNIIIIICPFFILIYPSYLSLLFFIIIYPFFILFLITFKKKKKKFRYFCNLSLNIFLSFLFYLFFLLFSFNSFIYFIFIFLFLSFRGLAEGGARPPGAVSLLHAPLLRHGGRLCLLEALQI